MSETLTVECQTEFRRLVKGRKRMQETPARPRAVVPPGRVPRVARWMALAIRFDQLLREVQVASYAELARLGHVTRARVTQIMNLLNWLRTSRRTSCSYHERNVDEFPSSSSTCYLSLPPLTGSNSDKCGRTAKCLAELLLAQPEQKTGSEPKIDRICLARLTFR
jgi:hypothetical protein